MEGGVEGAVRIVVEAVQDACLGTVRLHHLDGRERLLQARGEIAVGEPVFACAAAYARREHRREPNHRHADEDAGDGDCGAKEIQEHQRKQRPEEGREGADQRLLQQVHDHGAVLIDPEHGVAHPGVAVVLERQVLGPLDHRHAQALVDVVPNPRLVVGQRSEAAEQHEATDAEPDEQAVAHDPALFGGQRFLVGGAGGDVLLADPKHHGLQRLQALADEHFVGEEIASNGPNRHHEDGGHRADRHEGNQMPQHGTDERPSPRDELPQATGAHGGVRLYAARSLISGHRGPLGGGGKMPSPQGPSQRQRTACPQPI